MTKFEYKRSLMRLALISAFAIGSFSPTYSVFAQENARQLIDQCDGKNVTLNPIACWQYFDAVIESSLITSEKLKQPPIFCLPEVYSNKMLRESALAWINKNEWVQSLPAPTAIIGAMERQFPCSLE